MRLLCIILCICLSVPTFGETDEAGQIGRYADAYVKCESADSRLGLANDFFAYLLKIDYIDQPIAFPAGSHIDSVDVNVYYYIAEWHYGQGDYQAAVDYCTHATRCMGVVDDQSKSDVYALLGAAYFRMSAYDKAVKALNHCYELDKKTDDMDRMSSTLNSIASVFTAAGKPEEAEKYVLEAIAANSLTDNLARRAVLFGTMSEILHTEGDADGALEYAQKALDTERLLGDSARIGVRLSQMANARMEQSQIDEAQRLLDEAIPMLYQSKNYHSWGICQNQLGDILASKGRNEQAASHYLEAAMLFLKQGDMYNELHAREGLYKVTKAKSPNEAMLHQERAKQLKDSIYQNETSEALAKYNAIYYNDILQKENERIVQRNHTFLAAAAVSFAVLLVIIAFAVFYTYRHHKRKVKDYEQNISSLQKMFDELRIKYQNVDAYTMQESASLTDDDKQFLSQLASVIYAVSEKGHTDVDTIAQQMDINVATLRRRLVQTLSITPKNYILRMRLQKAKYLLQNNRDMNIAEVAYKCGYSQVPNFSRAFTNYYGITPTEVKSEKGEN